MEFKNENGAAVKNGTAKENNNGAANATAKNAPAGTTKSPAGNTQDELQKVKSGQEEPPVNQSPAKTPEQQTPATGMPPELSLEAKLKVVNDLHRRSIQRLNLIARIRQLEAFEVELSKDNDELEDNPYQGCKLIIRNDKDRGFVTTTPGLIRMVAQYIFNACNEKLVVIESTINFPNL